MKGIFDLANQITASMSATDKEKLLNMDMAPIAQALQSMDLGAVMQSEGKDVVKPCPLELADVYTGRQLQVTIKRRRLTGAGTPGATRFEKATLKLHVPAGAADGTIVRFPKAGDEIKPGVYSDLVVVLKVEPDRDEQAPLLNVEGQNLVWELDVPLWELYTMNRQLTVFGHKAAAAFTVDLQWAQTTPMTEFTVPGRGMPAAPAAVLLAEAAADLTVGPRGDFIVRLRPQPPTFRDLADVTAFQTLLVERTVALSAVEPAPATSATSTASSAPDTDMA